MHNKKTLLQIAAGLVTVAIFLSLFICQYPLLAIWQFIGLLWILMVERESDFSRMILKGNGELRGRTQVVKKRKVSRKNKNISNSL